MCLAIFGGALLPVAVGRIADSFGLSTSFIVPLAAYAFIIFFAAGRGKRKGIASKLPAPSPIPCWRHSDDPRVPVACGLDVYGHKLEVHRTCSAPSSARLVWHDEFNGNALQANKWQYDTSRNKLGWFNGERQYYSAGQNLRIANGLLTIEARRDRLDPQKFPDWGGQEYTSSKIFSRGAGWTYGFYEIRAKLPCGAEALGPRSGCCPSHEEMARRRRDRHHGAVGRNQTIIYASLPYELVQLHTTRTQRSAQRRVPTSCSALPRLSAGLASNFDHYRRRRARHLAGSQQPARAVRERGRLMLLSRSS